MKLSRFSQGIAALAIVLALYAFFFDALPAAIACCGLVILLAARVFLFITAFSSTARSLTIHRSLSSLLIRQGFPVTVRTEIRVTIPPGFSAEISDLPPRGTVLSSGTPTALVENSSSCRINFTLIPKVIGEHAFEGVRLSLSDPFFSSELVCRIPDMTAPSLMILPSLEFTLKEKDSYGDKETFLARAIASPDLKSFREYLPGDDLRKIDWKISAKYDTLFIREHIRQAEHGPLLIIDLPDASLPFSPVAFNLLKEEVVSAIATEMSSRIEFSVLIICGPNVVSFTPIEQDTRRFVAMINEVNPHPQLHYMYRYSSTASLKRRFSPVSGAVNPFSRTLGRISAAFLVNRPPTSFEMQIARIFHSIPGGTVHLFTIAAHDASHIRVISELAAINALSLKIHLPKEEYGEASRARLRRSLAALAEVV
jgi:uncharacterized protein (DUF58 family)